MRAELFTQQGARPPQQTVRPDRASTALRIAELARAGLVSAEMGTDGAFSYALTGPGRKAARQMGMGQDVYALVLLGMLVGAGAAQN